MAKKHGLAKRILDGADAFASLFSGGELAVLGAFAALLGGSVMRRSRYRRLTRRRVRQQFDRTIERICAALAEEAQSVARDTLVHAYEATAEEISAFAEEFAADSERMQREMTQIVDDLTRQINNSIEIELRHMRRDTDDVYRQVIEQARRDWLSPGNASRLNAEVQNAINEFAGRGVTGFTDKAGRRWGLYEYANMAMRTAIHRAGLQATIDAMRASGYDLAYITRHPGACPLCERWYGTILSISGNDPTHPSLQGAMDQGLFHPNCADVLQVYFPGVSDLTAGMGEYTPEQSAERYAASQRQRALEREIRKWKRMQAAAIAPEQERVAKAHIDRLQRQLRALTGETKLPRRYDREGGRVRLSEAARKIKPFTIDENGRVIADGAIKQESSPGASEKSAVMPLQNASGAVILQYTSIEQTEAPTIAAKEETDAPVASTKESGDGVNFICKLDRSIYSCVTEDITTDEVVITSKQITHIFEGHPEEEHAKVIERLAESVQAPDYIIADPDPRTAIVFKMFVGENDERYRIILKLAGNDPEHPKNSIITAFYISEKKWNKYLRNKKVLYRRDGL